MNFWRQVQDYEMRLLASALEKAKGNRTQAARLLNLNRTTLVEMAKKYGLTEKFPSQQRRTALE